MEHNAFETLCLVVDLYLNDSSGSNGGINAAFPRTNNFIGRIISTRAATGFPIENGILMFAL